jgi:hypothetical protein
MPMEQWVLFVVVISPAVFFDIDPPHKAAELWKPLRQGLLYFLSYRKGQHRPELWNTARNHLLQCARLVEETSGGKHLCTVQLHSAVAHLVDYVELYGPAAFRAEFWVERMVQVRGLMSPQWTFASSVITTWPQCWCACRLSRGLPSTAWGDTPARQLSYTCRLQVHAVWRRDEMLLLQH